MTAAGGAPELVVRDDHGRALALEPTAFGRGGQGRVYRVRDSRLAVKLVDGVRWRPDAAEGLASRLRAIGRLPLDGLPLSRPVAHLVEPHVGYVMELLESVVPLKELGHAQDDEDLSDWYLKGGGLRRRLRVLTRLAWVLATLHGRGVVYGDPSPTNIVISGRTDRDHLWLIDTDNLAVQTDAARDVAGTPGYGAPELASSTTKLSTLSDAFAFAVLTFETLTSLHPFKGDQVYDEEETAALGRAATAFELPWVDHTTDDSNRLSYGISRDWVLTGSLHQLFHEMFEEGLRTPLARPGMAAWYAALARAADATRGCQNCRHTYYVHTPACPWCGMAAPPVLAGRVFVQLRRPKLDPEEDGAEFALADTRDLVVVERDCWTVIPARVGQLMPRAEPFEPMASVSWDGHERITAYNPGPQPFYLVSQDGRTPRRLAPREQLPVTIRPGSPTWLLHLTDRLSAPHRVVAFDLHAWRH